jgi:hypothetical protein
MTSPDSNRAAPDYEYISFVRRQWDNTFSKHWSKADAAQRSLNMNSTSVNVDLFRSKSGKGTNLDAEKAAGREEEK